MHSAEGKRGAGDEREMRDVQTFDWWSGQKIRFSTHFLHACNLFHNFHGSSFLTKEKKKESDWYENTAHVKELFLIFGLTLKIKTEQKIVCDWLPCFFWSYDLRVRSRKKEHNKRLQSLPSENSRSKALAKLLIWAKPFWLFFFFVCLFSASSNLNLSLTPPQIRPAVKKSLL